MIVYVLFVYKKSVSKRKVCIIFWKNLKKFKKPQKNIFNGFFRWFFWFFLGGFFIGNPATQGAGLVAGAGGNSSAIGDPARRQEEPGRRFTFETGRGGGPVQEDSHERGTQPTRRRRSTEYDSCVESPL